MKWIALPDNEPETINKILDEVYKLIKSQEEKIKELEKKLEDKG